MVLDTHQLGGFHFMLYTDYTQKLLNLQGVLVKIEMPVTPHACPHCGTHTSYIHDYRKQLIKDILPLSGSLLSSITGADDTAVPIAANASPSSIPLSRDTTE